MKYESNKHIYDFKKFQTIRSFGDSIFNRTITIREADKKQSNLLERILKSNDKVRPGSKTHKEKKINIYESIYTLYES